MNNLNIFACSRVFKIENRYMKYLENSCCFIYNETRTKYLFKTNYKNILYQLPTLNKLMQFNNKNGIYKPNCYIMYCTNLTQIQKMKTEEVNKH